MKPDTGLAAGKLAEVEHRIVFHPAALEELRLIGDRIEQAAGPQRAAAFVGEIRDFCDDLRIFPERGTVRREIAPNLRVIGYRRAVSVAFAVQDDVVMILGVFAAGRNIVRELFQERL